MTPEEALTERGITLGIRKWEDGTYSPILFIKCCDEHIDSEKVGPKFKTMNEAKLEALKEFERIQKEVEKHEPGALSEIIEVAEENHLH